MWIGPTRVNVLSSLQGERTQSGLKIWKSTMWMDPTKLKNFKVHNEDGPN